MVKTPGFKGGALVVTAVLIVIISILVASFADVAYDQVSLSPLSVLAAPCLLVY